MFKRMSLLKEKKKINHLKRSLWESPKLFFKWLMQKIVKFSCCENFFQNKIILTLLGLSILVNVVNWLILVIFIRPVDVDIILHYNVYFGVDMMGNWKQVFIAPFIGSFLLVANTILATYFYRHKERVASYILLLTTLMVQISFIIASASIIKINY